MVLISRETLLLTTAILNQARASLHRSLPVEVEEGWSLLLDYYALGRHDNLEATVAQWSALLAHKEKCNQNDLRGIIDDELNRPRYTFILTALSQIKANSYNFRPLEMQFIYCSLKELSDMLSNSCIPDNEQVKRLCKDLWYCLCIIERRAINLRGRKYALKVEHFRAAHWKHYLTIQEVMEHRASV